METEAQEVQVDEVALTPEEEVFARFCDLWEIKSDVDGLDEEDRQGYQGQRERFIEAVKRKRLDVHDDGTLTYRFVKPPGDNLTQCTINFPTGAALMGFDRLKDRQVMGKVNSFIGHITKISPAILGSDHCDLRDLKVLQAIANLFLAS